MDRIADSLDTLISNQNRLIAIIANTAGMQTNPLHPLPRAYLQQYFPCLPPFLPAG